MWPSYPISLKKKIQIKIRQKSFHRLLYVYPDSMLRSELFPAPDGPKIALSSPDRNFPLIPLSMPFFSANKKIKNLSKK